MAIITLKREKDDGVGIRGQIYDVDGKQLVFCLEPSINRKSYPGVLPGTYQLAYTKSTRLSQATNTDYWTLELMNVPAVVNPSDISRYPQDWRGGIRIHSFNTPDQSLGCIGPGLGRGLGNFVSSSKLAVVRIEAYVRGLMTLGIPVFICIIPTP